MPYETDFQKILKITRYAVRDANIPKENAPTSFTAAIMGGAVLVSSQRLSRKLIECWFRGYKRKVVMD